MFNLKKHVYSVDLRQETLKQMFGTTNPRELAQYISENIDKELGEALSNGEISVDDVYKMLGDTSPSIPFRAGYEFLDEYRANITDILGMINNIATMADPNGLSKDDIAKLIVDKLLSRVNEVFVPKLIELNKLKARSFSKIQGLELYSDPQQQESIKNFIQREIKAKKEEVVRAFQIILREALSIGVTQEQVMILLNNTLPNSKKLLPPIEGSLKVISDKITKLKVETSTQSNKNEWLSILAKEFYGKFTIENKEQWEYLIPQPIVWNLPAIIESVGYDIYSLPDLDQKENRVNFRNYEIQNQYYSFFYPPYDQSGLPWMSQDDFDFIKFESPEYFAPDMDLRMLEVRDPEVNRIKIKQYERKKNYALTKLSEVIQSDYNGRNIIKILSTGNDLPSDDAGIKLTFYFRSSLPGMCAKRIDKFITDLDRIGAEETIEALKSKQEKRPDTNYSDFNFKFLSDEEGDIVNKLRYEYGLDAIPYPVTVPCPTDCPTNTNSFTLDFLVSADVFEAVGRDGKPIITPKVMFSGEFYAYKSDLNRTLDYQPGKPYVTPDGEIYNPPVNKRTGEIYDPVVEGNKVKEKHIYQLRTMWKKRTYSVLANLLGTDYLSFYNLNDDQIMNELDGKNIIYDSTHCKTAKRPIFGVEKEFCYAKKQIMMLNNNLPEQDKQYTEIFENPNYIDEHIDDEKKKCLRIIESAIISIKISDGVKQIKKDFVGKENGFDRKTLQLQHNYVRNLYIKREQIAGRAKSGMLTKEDFEEQEYINIELKELNNSPMSQFKKALDNYFQTGKLKDKIDQLNFIKEKIINNQIPADLKFLKIKIDEIDAGVFGYYEIPNA